MMVVTNKTKNCASRTRAFVELYTDTYAKGLFIGLENTTFSPLKISLFSEVLGLLSSEDPRTPTKKNARSYRNNSSTSQYYLQNIHLVSGQNKKTLP